MRGRPGASAPKMDLEKEKNSLVKQFGKHCEDDELFSSVMYPQVFKDFQDFKKNTVMYLFFQH